MKLIGLDKELSMGLNALKRKQPVLFYGFTGNGKTLLAWELAKKYKEQFSPKSDIVYLQLYPEMTKNTLIGGETIRNGNIVTKTQTLINMGAKKCGTIFIVDECTHTTEPVLLAFNSLIEEPYSTVVGDTIYKLDENTRFIFCGNFPDHAGNIHLPTSFANRLFIIQIGMPDKNQLIAIGIQSNKDSPMELIDFVSDILLKVHEPSFPVSPRNIVLFSNAVTDLFKSGYRDNNHIPKQINKILKDLDINHDLLKETILSTLMAHTKLKTQGPDKIRALLWE